VALLVLEALPVVALRSLLVGLWPVPERERLLALGWSAPPTAAPVASLKICAGGSKFMPFFNKAAKALSAAFGTTTIGAVSTPVAAAAAGVLVPA
jgi:hypothetical protein